jgi:hypothetical protein
VVSGFASLGGGILFATVGYGVLTRSAGFFVLITLGLAVWWYLNRRRLDLAPLKSDDFVSG